ncbi:MAG: PKD domain-containing protein [Bacteroidota bacterium]
MKKIITYVIAGCLAISGGDLFGQTTTGEGFESATAFPPTGWQTVGGGGGGGSPTWSRRTTANAGTTPVAKPFGGAGMARFSSNNATAGGTQTLGSPVIDLSKRGTANSYISLYMYRDSTYKGGDSVSVWFNTSRSLTGAKRLGGIARYCRKTMPDSVANGWYKYSFAIPSSFTGTTNYFLIQATARGGAQGGNIFIDSVTWDAYPTFCAGKPTAGKLAGSPLYICGNGGQSVMTLSGNTTSTGISYNWQQSSDSLTFTTNAAWTAPSNTGFFFAAQGKYRYVRVIVTCANSGLKDTSNCIRIWIDNTATPPTITVTPTNATICAGAKVGAKLVASGASTYSWTPTTGLSSTMGDTIYALPSASTFYTVSGVDAKGCTGQRNVAVQIASGPTVAVTATDTMVCEGDSVQLTATVTGGGTFTYAWSTGSVKNTTFAKAVGSTSNYTVGVKNAAGCETKVVKTIYGVLKPVNSYKFTVITGRKVQFDFTGSNAKTVYWNFSDGNESFQKTTTYSFSADGTFKVMLVANNPPCKSDTVYFDVKVTTVPSAINNMVLTNLTMRPNPSDDQAYITFNGVESNVAVMVLDAMGRVVYRNNYDVVDGYKGIWIPTDTLSNGLYQVRIGCGKGVSTLGLQVAH